MSMRLQLGHTWAGTYIIPDRLRISLHALGCFTHLLVEDSAVFRVDNIFEYYKAISMEGDDGCSNVLFGHTTRCAFFIGDPDGDWVLELEWRCSHGSHCDC